MNSNSFCLSDKPCCPSCGAAITAETTGIVHCQYCGTDIFVNLEKTILSRIVYPQVKTSSFRDLVSTYIGKKYKNRVNWKCHYYPFWQFKADGRQITVPAINTTEYIPVGDLMSNSLQAKNDDYIATIQNELVDPELDLTTVLSLYAIKGEVSSAVLLQLPYYDITVKIKNDEYTLTMDGLTGEIWSQELKKGGQTVQWLLALTLYFIPLLVSFLAFRFIPHFFLSLIIVLAVTLACGYFYGQKRVR